MNNPLKAELHWRAHAWNDLVEFARSVEIPGVPQEIDEEGIIPKIETDLADHHILILETLQKLSEGHLTCPDGEVCKRAMFFMPPGSAKSTYCSVVFPSWYIGKYGDTPIILTGYGDQIAKKHGKRARQVCMSREYQAIFDTTIQADTKAADNWALTNGSSYLASGLQSGLTGNRAAGLIIDDPVRGRHDAESKPQQLATWAAYKDDARTRKIPNAWEVIVSTRWHENDLCGMILPENWSGESGFLQCDDGNLWYIVCLPAQAERDDDPLGRKPGEYLWSEWFGGNFWEPLKLDSRSWGSLYQQVPTPPEGDYFKQSWVQYYDHLPKDVNKYLSADYAVTRSEDADDPDFTAMAVWAMDSDGALFFVTGYYGKVDSAEWTDIALDFVELHEPLAHIAGGGPIRRGTEPWMKRRMRERKTFVTLVWYPETFNKEENARSFQAMMANGMVHWPRGNEVAEWFIRQLTGFGTLRYDDAVDACSMIGRHVAKLWETKKPKPVEPALIIKPGAIAVAGIGAKQLKKRDKISGRP